MKLALVVTEEDFPILCDALLAASQKLIKESADLSEKGYEGEAINLLDRTSKRLEVLRGQIINQLL
ncbi:MAG: hypothetical protein ACK45I_10465 [Bacteroidota bacterium]|jgi:hypothetical protein